MLSVLESETFCFNHQQILVEDTELDPFEITFL